MDPPGRPSRPEKRTFIARPLIGVRGCSGAAVRHPQRGVFGPVRSMRADRAAGAGWYTTHRRPGSQRRIAAGGDHRDGADRGAPRRCAAVCGGAGNDPGRDDLRSDEWGVVDRVQHRRHLQQHEARGRAAHQGGLRHVRVRDRPREHRPWAASSSEEAATCCGPSPSALRCPSWSRHAR